MKNVYMDVTEQYGHIPKGFDLGEYLHKKEIENAEWEEHEKNLQSEKEDSAGEHDKNGNCQQSFGKDSKDTNKNS